MDANRDWRKKQYSPSDRDGVFQLRTAVYGDPYREEDWVWRGAPLHIPFYAVGGHKIWGATAIVLAEFLALLTQ